jgi:hypothetical protein
MNQIFYDNLYRTECVSNIIKGTPFQNIQLYLKFSQYYFYIYSNINHRNYNRNLSKSFKIKREEEIFFPSYCWNIKKCKKRRS